MLLTLPPGFPHALLLLLLHQPLFFPLLTLYLSLSLALYMNRDLIMDLSTYICVEFEHRMYDTKM